MNRSDRIHDCLVGAFSPAALQVDNESRRHNVPAGSETHFKVVVVSDVFVGRSLVERHRMVHEALDAELRGGIHALSIHARTPEEWQARGGVIPSSPPCMGGSKPDARG